MALVLAAPLSAHVVATDGPIGVTMHVDPDDAPVAGTVSRFYLWFKDTTDRLKPEDCRGTFSVADANDYLVVSQPLFARSGSGLTDVHDVTFAKPGVYTIRINGAPQAVTTFSPFLITFQVRVGGASAESGLPAWPFYAGGGVLAALLLWWGLRPRRER
jgi:hypothetical protein